MKPTTILPIGLLFIGIASAAPLAAQHIDEPTLLAHQLAKRGDISSTYCDVNPEVFPCSEFCKGNQLADFCRPEYCEHDPGHWSCKPKYIESNDTNVDDTDGGLYATLISDRTTEQGNGSDLDCKVDPNQMKCTAYCGSSPYLAYCRPEFCSQYPEHYVCDKNNRHLKTHGMPGNSEYKDYNFGGGFFSGKDITSVTGTFVVPEVFSSPQDVKGEYAAILLGIADRYCDETRRSGEILAGVSLHPDGEPEVYVRWWPEDTVTAKNMTISAGDSITMTVTLSDNISGSATIENSSKNTTFTHEFTADGLRPVCDTKAHWTVGQSKVKYPLAGPLANFTTVIFTDTSVTADSEVMTGVSKIEERFLVDRLGFPLADTSIVDNSINVTYLKPLKIRL
ncbi:concanavalin A-like lectin/glucanase, partial [Aureobasidium melanogenum]